MAKLLTGLLCGIFIGVAGCAILAYVFLVCGLVPARQDEPASDFERWAAHQSLQATLNFEADTLVSSIPADEKNLMRGARIYASSCLVCHGAPLCETPPFAAAYSPAAPLFASGDSVSDDPEGHIFWKVDHGIRFTGMPSFNRLLSEKEIWQVSLFLKNLDKLPPPVSDYWKQMK